MGAYGPSSVEPHKNVLLPVEAWDADVEYTELSVVFHDGGLWVAAADNTNSEPTTSNADWSLAVGGGTTYTTPCLTVAPDVANQVVICGSTTGDPTSISAVGSDMDLALLLKGQGATSVWMSGGDSTCLLIDHGGNHADIAHDEPVPLAPALIVANDIPSDGVLGLLAYQANNAVGAIVKIVSLRGTPGSPVPGHEQDLIHQQVQYANLDTGSYSNTVVAEYNSELQLDSSGGAGANQTWVGYTATGASVNIIKYFADVAGDNSGVDQLSFLTNSGQSLDLSGQTGLVTVSNLAVSTRTGTDATVAMFTTGGVLCEVTGASGSYTTADLKTVTVTRGIITSIST